MIKIKTIVHKELLTYIASDEFINNKVIPISPIRALSQAHNPVAQGEDIILILAYQGETLVGYLGILPDDIFDKMGNFLHIGWLSCIWVDDKLRGMGIAKKLLHQAYKDWDGHIVLAQFTQQAYDIYKKMDIFAPLVPPSKGLRLYIKSDLASILPQKKPFLKNLTFLLKGGDFAFNLFLNPFSTNTILPFQYKTTFLEHIRPNDLPIDIPFNYLIPTSLAKLNWILKYPWVKKIDKKNDLEKRYFFTCIDDSIEHFFVKISDERDNILATFFLLKRKHIVKIPYLYVSNKEDAMKVIHFIVDYMKKKNISTFVCYHPMLVQILQQAPMGFIHKREKENPYLVGINLLDKLPDLSQFIFQDGDGDAAFT